MGGNVFEPTAEGMELMFAVFDATAIEADCRNGVRVSVERAASIASSYLRRVGYVRRMREMIEDIQADKDATQEDYARACEYLDAADRDRMKLRRKLDESKEKIRQIIDEM